MLHSGIKGKLRKEKDSLRLKLKVSTIKENRSNLRKMIIENELTNIYYKKMKLN